MRTAVITDTNSGISTEEAAGDGHSLHLDARADRWGDLS